VYPKLGIFIVLYAVIMFFSLALQWNYWWCLSSFKWPKKSSIWL